MASNTRFHNDTSALNHLWYESHRNLITSLCIELGHTDQVDAMVQKHLGQQLKMKTLKDPNKPKRAKSAYLFFSDAMNRELQLCSRQDFHFFPVLNTFCRQLRDRYWLVPSMRLRQHTLCLVPLLGVHFYW